ncbi:MAG: hypothetical protein JST16_01525 [Bdellovibrionales bacterium]|nr:hypothetical protein [Bdellovibrionales bacterium]
METAVILLAAAALTLAVSRCGFVAEEGLESEGPPSTGPEFVDGKAAFAADVIAGDSANTYSVSLAWPSAPEGSTAVVVKRRDHAGQVLQLDLMTPSTQSYLDQSVKAGESYTYEIMALSGEKLASIASGAVKVPRDFQVQGTVEASEVGPEFNRLFIEKDSTLLSRGVNVSVSVNEIVAREGARITSLPVSVTAAPNKTGASVDLIHIKARAATGVLTVLSIGQGGGAGIKGSAGGTGASGARGANGEADYYPDCWMVRLPRIPLMSSFREGPGHCSKSWYCKRQTGDGTPGGQGLPGGAGSPGQAGGDTARILVEVAEPRDFQIHHELIPGVGGEGGAGGNGGLGGNGGEPGSRDSHNQCRVASRGPNGPRGNSGTRGAPGPAGRVQSVCLRLGSASSGDCSNF